ANATVVLRFYYGSIKERNANRFSNNFRNGGRRPARGIAANRQVCPTISERCFDERYDPKPHSRTGDCARMWLLVISRCMPRDALRRQFWLICCALFLGTLAIYSPVRQFEFLVYDDLDYVTQNRWVKAGLTSESFAWAFANVQVHNWHPLTLL